MTAPESGTTPTPAQRLSKPQPAVRKSSNDGMNSPVNAEAKVTPHPRPSVRKTKLAPKFMPDLAECEDDPNEVGRVAGSYGSSETGKVGFCLHFALFYGYFMKTAIQWKLSTSPAE